MEKSDKKLSYETVYDGFADGKQIRLTTELETYLNPLWWQLKGLSYTASGYGGKIPTVYMVKHNHRLKRVYCRILSNIGTCYILDHGERIIIND